jgi:hypothetical protein
MEVYLFRKVQDVIGILPCQIRGVLQRGERFRHTENVEVPRMSALARTRAIVVWGSTSLCLIEYHLQTK